MPTLVLPPQAGHDSCIADYSAEQSQMQTILASGLERALIDGAIRVRGRRVDLANISMPLYLLAGATDHITPPDQVFAISELASTPPELVRRHVTTGGHLGLFMGH